MTDLSKTTVVIAADANYFHLLQGTVLSLHDSERGRSMAISILDLGLTPVQVAWLGGYAKHIVTADWDIEFPGRDKTPGYFKAMTARPYLRRYFPGYETYLWIDSDTWVQDDRVLDYYVRGAQNGKLAIVPEIDRAYFPFYKRPRLYFKTQNHRAYRWAYGWRIADKLARNPILNSGAFALNADAPHWDLWADALHTALNRRGRGHGKGIRNLYARIIEQTALNYVVYADGASATFLPAYCNWFCGKGTPMVDAHTGDLVEPHEPHQPLGIVHLAGDNIQERVFDLETTEGGTLKTLLTYDAYTQARATIVGDDTPRS